MRIGGEVTLMLARAAGPKLVVGVRDHGDRVVVEASDLLPLRMS
jgi:hypothetical protein